MPTWWRETTVLPRAVNSPASPQQAPLYYRPHWHVEHLVYQGGIPILKASALNGGGFIPMKDGYAGRFVPGWQPYATPVTSIVGPGVLPVRPNFLQRLLGGFMTTNQQ